MLKKSLIVVAWVWMVGLQLTAEEVVKTPMEGPVAKCDTLYDECVKKCKGEGDTVCIDGCQDEAQKCDLENAPTN
jgi:hypothetical protein